VLTYLCRTLLAAGKYPEAEKSSQESLERAREIGYRAGEGMALDALGQLAYARGSCAEAQPFYAEGIRLLREIGATLPLTRALCHQGINLLALGDPAHAQAALAEALRIASAASLVASGLTALAGVAVLCAHTGAGELGLEIVIHVLEHPVSTREAKNIVAPLRTKLESELTKEQVHVAQQRARSRTYDELSRLALGLDEDAGSRVPDPSGFLASNGGA
jgi:tetratricopeptide (TPR) repeat protein